MSYFFAEKMSYCEALVPAEMAWDVFDELGRQSKIALDSKVINYDNPYLKSYRRCEELITKIEALRGILDSCKSWINFQLKEIKDDTIVWKQFEKDSLQKKMQGYLFINKIEEEILQSHRYLFDQMHEIQGFTKQISALVLQISLLLALGSQQKLQQLNRSGVPLQEDISEWEKGSSSMFETRCIGITRKQLLMLKRSIFRITRGNSWINEIQISQQDVNRYFSSAKHRKLADQALKDHVVCVIVFQKGERNIVQSKIDRLLAVMNCEVMVKEQGDVAKQLEKLQRNITEIEAMEDLTFQGIRKYIRRLSEVRQGGAGSWICQMHLYAKKQREIYKSLSTTEVSKNLIRFRLYIPTKQLPLNIQPKKNLPPLTLNLVDSDKMPPSKFDTNCMLSVPQEIVNTYGVPSYHEINPAPFYIVTFAFFIGVMFGDIGHMLMAMSLLIYFKANLWFWMVIFFMGYCGLIYNEFFGLNLGIFSSCYSISGKDEVTYEENCVFPVGIDSIWKVSMNEMSFINSLKMKVAVILGVVHMMFGLFLKLYNNLRQKKWTDILTLTIPQLVFMCCTFVYMDYIIIYKWSQNYEDSSKAPSVISTMIAVFVNMAKDDPKDLLFWPSQRSTQRILVTLALLCVPIMLLGKTLVIWFQRRKSDQLAQPEHIQLQELAQQNDAHQEQIINQKLSSQEFKSTIFSNKQIIKQHHQEESLKEIAVHQFIQTIEFVLGSVSNTASYLRLWALSLAHAQLSTVIFQLTVLKQLQKGYNGILGLFLVFPFFLMITFGVLICMDSLECFLHSLRLHWVQFQNKFYEGKGYLFEPLTFKNLK